MRMLTSELRPHPRNTGEAVRRIGVDIAVEAGSGALQFRYRLEGDIGRLLLPAADFARRSDGLWQHTCFEAFLRPDASESYHEFNFAPSGDWAAWRFGARRRDRSIPGMPPPLIRFRAGADRCELIADISIPALPQLAAASTIHAGLCAVVETRDNGLSHWALSHGSEAPDFHDPATFAMQVTPR